MSLPNEHIMHYVSWKSQEVIEEKQTQEEQKQDFQNRVQVFMLRNVE